MKWTLSLHLLWVLSTLTFIFLEEYLNKFICLLIQKDFDMAWPRGAVKEKIFEPWMDSLRAKGCKFEEDRRVTDLIYSEETGCVSEVVCGRATYKADAVIMVAAVSSLQEIIKKRYAVSEFGSFLSLYG